ncbi:hypothetical protein K491DRAFT_723527 [Lophiostoma macrostomum CBS 122681]|uniref:Uncharacterized protein n=1 Tax=Lophiostoma macrostomum CBS 122681 TaxID=1314788 RepID=A0A6A6SHJ0_9PLEO|nr:hypothetical protein K491DRAFT_723527 [Lophiostoma macrostomum CBS 122681]
MPVNIIPRSMDEPPPSSSSNGPPQLEDTDVFPALPISNGVQSSSLPVSHSKNICKERAEYSHALQKVGTYATVLTNGTDKTCYPSTLYAYMHGFVYFPQLPKELRAEVYEWAMAGPRYTIDIRNFFLHNFPAVCFATVEAMQIFVATRTIQVRHPDDCNTVLMVMTSVRSGLECIGKVDLAGLGNHREEDDGDEDEGYNDDNEGEEADDDEERGSGDVGDKYDLQDDGEDDVYHKDSTNPYMELLKCWPLSEHALARRIVKFYKLDELLHCTNMSTIKFATGRDSVPKSTYLVAEWIKAEFKKRTGKSVKVFVELQ